MVYYFHTSLPLFTGKDMDIWGGGDEGIQLLLRRFLGLVLQVSFFVVFENLFA